MVQQLELSEVQRIALSDLNPVFTPDDGSMRREIFAIQQIEIEVNAPET